MDKNLVIKIINKGNIMHANKLIIILSIFVLSSCATITTGQNQALSVETFPESNAQCELKNDKGIWYIPSTPGSVMVTRSYGDLNVICKKQEKTGIIAVKSSTKGMTAGNILVGGLIGLAVDASTGSAYDYPPHIQLSMK